MQVLLPTPFTKICRNGAQHGQHAGSALFALIKCSAGDAAKRLNLGAISSCEERIWHLCEGFCLLPFSNLCIYSVIICSPLLREPVGVKEGRG